MYFTDEDGHNYIIERFFNNTARGGIETEIKTMIKKWIKKKRPVPILNTFILNRILNNAQKLNRNDYNTI